MATSLWSCFNRVDSVMWWRLRRDRDESRKNESARDREEDSDHHRRNTIRNHRFKFDFAISTFDCIFVDFCAPWCSHCKRLNPELNEEGLLVLKGLDSRLAKNLPPDLQKLRCKVAFHALRFAAPIENLGNKLARRMWIEGPYIALHLRLEKDVWVRTGCLTGLGSEFDRIIAETRMAQPRYLTGRLNMSYTERRLAGFCPLNAYEIARLLKALGAPRNASIYIAGGEPFGGSRALEPLAKEFSNLVTKETLAHKGELLPYTNRSSALAAIDYIVSLSSDVFLPSHGGNMAKAMQGNRAYVGHRKFIMPNKRAMLPLMENSSVSDSGLSFVTRKLHRKSQGHPESRRGRRDRDVIAYPVPECMCRNGKHRSVGFF